MLQKTNAASYGLIRDKICLVKRFYEVVLPDSDSEPILLVRVGPHPIMSTHLGMHTFDIDSIEGTEFELFSSFENQLKVVPFHKEGRPKLRHAVIRAGVADWRLHSH